MEKLVSIIIPTYRDSYFVKNFSLRSVLNQTYSNFEVLIGSDGENPELKEYLLSLKDNRIKYWAFKKSNFKNDRESWCVGGALARNECLKLAKGDLIAPLDHDDIWCSTYLEKRVKFFIENPDTEFTYAKAVHIKNDKIIGILGFPEAWQIPHLTVVYLSKFKDLKYIESGDTAADYLLWKKFKDNNISMTFIDEIVSLYNEKNNSIDIIEAVYIEYFKEPFKEISRNL